MFYAHVHAEPFSYEGHHIGVFSTLLDAQTVIKDLVHPDFRTDVRPVWCSFPAEATSTDTDGTELITMFVCFANDVVCLNVFSRYDQPLGIIEENRVYSPVWSRGELCWSMTQRDSRGRKRVKRERAKRERDE